MLSNFKPATFWLLVMLTVLGVLGGQLLSSRQAPIETNILELLPENRQDPLAEAAFDQTAASMSEKVLFVIGGQDKSALFTAAEQFSQGLGSVGMFDEITATFSSSLQQEWGKLYYPKRAQLLTAEQKVRLQQDPQQQLRAVLQALYNPFSGVTSQELESDPFLLFRDYISALGMQSGRVTLENGFLTTTYNGTDYILLSADLAGSPYSLELQGQIPRLHELETSIRDSYGVDVQHTGVVFYAAHGTSSARGEISTIGLGSLLGVLTLFLLVYRSPLPLALALLSIFCGLLTAFTVTLAVFGKVHLFSLVFGASLIGVSIDYSFHFLTERLSAGRNWDARKGLKQIIAAISLGLTMSLMGYLCMMVAPFPGLQQLSLFSAAGLAAAFGTVVCWYPVLAARPGKTVTIPMSSAIDGWLQLWLKPSVRLGMPMLCLIAAALGLYYVTYNDDIRQLQALPDDLKQQEETIKAITGVSGSQQMLLVRAVDEQALLMQMEQVGEALDRLVEQEALEGYSSIHQYVPSKQVQRKNYQLLQQFYQQQGPILAQQLKMEKDIKLAQKFEPLTVHEFLRSSASEPLRFLWLGRLEGQQAAVILLKGVRDTNTLQALAAAVNNVSYLDKANEVSAIFAEYRQRISELLLAVLGVIFAILVWRYRVTKALRVILPPAVACVVGLSVTGLSGIPLNLFNLLALFLVLGIGIDYTLFFAEQAKANSILLAISLSAVTTILSFGLLSLSETQAIHSFGVTVLTGILIAWLLAPLALDVKVTDVLKVTDEARG